VTRDHLANAYVLYIWVLGKGDDEDSGSEIGHTIYPALDPLGGRSLRAASHLLYDHKYIYSVPL
jgi:hypothetical protein